MADDDDAVSRQVDVELEVRRAGLGGGAKRGERIFGVLAARAAMSDYAGRREIEEVAIQCRTGHTAGAEN